MRGGETLVEAPARPVLDSAATDLQSQAQSQGAVTDLSLPQSVGWPSHCLEVSHK